MPVGVEGFVPGRLRLARAARMIMQKELAPLIGRADTTISKWENEDQQQSPDAAIVSKLAEALNVDVSWFFRPVHSDASAAFFRSLKSELKLIREASEAKLYFVEAIYAALETYIDIPDVDVPNLLADRDFRTLRDSDIETYAMSLREHWGLGDDPIDDLLLVIENAGIIVAEDEIGSEKLDGVSYWSRATNRPYMLLAKDKNVGVRRRFDAAHELGHIVLHRNVSPEQLQEHFSLIEEQAMAFAGAFLLPEATFADDVYSLSLDVLASLKRKWKVSVAAMIKRLSRIGLVSSEYERRLWQYYSRRRWRGFEPLDDELPIEQPENLRISIEMIIDEGLASKTDLLKEIGISASQVTKLVGLEDNYFLPSAENLVRLVPKLRTRDVVDRDFSDDENVVSLTGKKLNSDDS